MNGRCMTHFCGARCSRVTGASDVIGHVTRLPVAVCRRSRRQQAQQSVLDSAAAAAAAAAVSTAGQGDEVATSC